MIHLEIPSVPSLILALLGGICVLRLLFTFLSFVWRYFLRPAHDLWQRYGRPGSWAIVTGASDGIGLEYCRQLAGHGFNVLMISRSQTKLEVKRKEIIDSLSGHAPEVEVFSLDFSQPYDAKTYENLAQTLKGKDIALLVNNVGNGNVCNFEDFPCRNIAEIVRVNSLSAVYMTRTVLGMMLQRTGKRCGIVTISSVFSCAPFKYNTIYGSTKKFLNLFMDSLIEEYRCYPSLDFMTCITGGVRTKMFDVKELTITPEKAVRCQLRCLGHDTQTCACMWHLATEWVIKYGAGWLPLCEICQLPEGVVDFKREYGLLPKRAAAEDKKKAQ